MIQLIYASVAMPAFDEKELPTILAKARRANGVLNVTGMLLYTEGGFFQVLEGPPAIVDDLFARICTDARHDGVVRIIRESIYKRSFGQWTMGYSAVTRPELTQIVGLNDFFNEGSCLAALDGSRAKKVLAAFAGGRWRARLSGSRQMAEGSPIHAASAG